LATRPGGCVGELFEDQVVDVGAFDDVREVQRQIGEVSGIDPVRVGEGTANASASLP